MRLEEHIDAIESAIGDPRRGLPQPVFDLLGRITPVLNVDLLIRNDRREILLTWRDDELYHGWHVPGGVVRFKERMEERVAAVARIELGTTVTIPPEPLAVTQIILAERPARGHFVSFLFDCTLTGPPDEALKRRGAEPKHGEWAWHAAYPSDMISSHEIYRRFFHLRQGSGGQVDAQS
jgi:ADP-ribose pyrophosphatase YjhB (NUDIX family)